MLTNTEMESIVAKIGNLDFDQCKELNERLTMQRTFLANQSVRSFVIGDTVTFTGRRGVVNTGEITKVNRRYVHVKVGHTNWKVPAEMLSKVA
jgi:S-adenosylhomocysteine hydrolase